MGATAPGRRCGGERRRSRRVRRRPGDALQPRRRHLNDSPERAALTDGLIEALDLKLPADSAPDRSWPSAMQRRVVAANLRQGDRAPPAGTADGRAAHSRLPKPRQCRVRRGADETTAPRLATAPNTASGREEQRRLMSPEPRDCLDPEHQHATDKSRALAHSAGCGGGAWTRTATGTGVVHRASSRTRGAGRGRIDEATTIEREHAEEPLRGAVAAGPRAAGPRTRRPQGDAVHAAHLARHASRRIDQRRPQPHLDLVRPAPREVVPLFRTTG